MPSTITNCLRSTRVDTAGTEWCARDILACNHPGKSISCPRRTCVIRMHVNIRPQRTTAQYSSYQLLYRRRPRSHFISPTIHSIPPTCSPTLTPTHRAQTPHQRPPAPIASRRLSSSNDRLPSHSIDGHPRSTRRTVRVYREATQRKRERKRHGK